VSPRALIRDDVLLDWNESPIGSSHRAVTRVIRGAGSLHLYPRGLLEEVTALTAGYLRVSPSEVLLTAGVDEAVDLALTLARRAWVVQPGFDGYAARAELSGKPLRTIRLGADWQPAAGPVPVLGADDMVFLAQPNNPTGNLFRPDWLADLGRAAPYVFLDETYQEFSSNRSVLDSAGAEPGRLVFRSFSKAMGLAGVRLGCLVTGARDMARLRPLQRFQPIDAVSLHAVAGTLQDPAFIRRLTSYVLLARPALVAILRASGLFSRVRDTEANFVLAEPRDGTAAAVLAGLDREGIRVKPCESIGLPGWMRISVGSAEAHRRLRECLSRMPGSADRRRLAACQPI
jgi:histidinol-phosphate aminotransferase